MPNGRKYDSSTMGNYVYFQLINGAVQNLMFSNYVDPSNFNISVEVQSGKIALLKTNNRAMRFLIVFLNYTEMQNAQI